MFSNGAYNISQLMDIKAKLEDEKVMERAKQQPVCYVDTTSVKLPDGVRLFMSDDTGAFKPE